MIPANALINSFGSDKPKRFSAPKSRSGCIACKHMHVRCDETKPTCTRCEKSGRPCQYSQPKQKTSQVVAPQPRTLLPKDQAINSEGLSVLLTQPRASSLKPHEVPYFDLFRWQMAHDFGQTSCALFWNRVLPREAMNDECVRFSVLSIGALMQTLYRNGTKPYTGLKSLTGPSRKSNDPTYRVALHYHSKVIAALKTRIKDHFATVSRRNILINMFLLVLFELLYGDTASADRMLTSSVDLLKQKKDQLLDEVNNGFEQQPQPLYTAVSDDEGLDQAERILPRLQILFSLNSCLFPLQRDCWSRFSAKATTSSVATAQAEISQFGTMWNSCITRTVIFVVKAMQGAQSCDAAKMAYLVAQRNVFLKQLRQWEKVIICKHNGETDQAIKKVIKIHHVGQKVVYILLNCCLDPTEMQYDNYDNVFGDIMTMMHSLTSTSGPATRIQTVLDTYILPILNFVSQKCRNASIRSGSLALFERMVSTMGGWETRASSLARRRLMALEESGRDESGNIPAGSRYIWTDMFWDGTQSYLGVYFQKAGPESSNDELVKMNIDLEELEA
ncbi:hypothetical protein FOBRF1_007111 [Fusarium oxysporum]